MKVIELTRGLVTIVDDEDFAELAQYRWSADANGYAVRRRRKGEKWGSHKVKMARFIMKAEKGTDVDHANGDVRDNRKSNLRLATRSENTGNSKKRSDNKTGVKGVHLDKKKNLFRVDVTKDGKTKYIGRFKRLEDAATAYARAATEAFGEFTRLN